MNDRPPSWNADTRIFLDTCSLMHPEAGRFLDTWLRPLSERLGVPPLVISHKVKGELERLAAATGEPGRRRQAREGLALVRRGLNEGWAEYRGEPGDSFPDNLFLSLFTHFRLRYRLVLVTQDLDLALDILGLNETRSVGGVRGVEVISVGRGGEALRLAADPERRRGIRHIPLASPQRPDPTPDSRPFARVTSVADWDDTPVHPGPVPGAGDEVRDAQGRRLRLAGELGRGGEGRVHELAVDPRRVAKIYAPGRLQRATLAKLERMTAQPLRHPALCWPLTLLQDAQGRPVGYLMPRAAGRELSRSLFIRPLFQTHFPDWDRTHLVCLAQTLLKILAYLHRHNVLVGDLNPRNILVEAPERVHLVDCDSYQVEGYPCPVGMPPFLAPRLAGQDLHRTLRAAEDEDFAVATLVFMLLMPGKPPYSHQGGGDPMANARKGHFPYALGPRRAQGVPGGAWRYLWSHLPYYLKEAFHRVFADGQRLPVEDWLDLLGRYRSDLGKGRFERDPFPTYFRDLDRRTAEKKGIRWKTCSGCGNGFPDYDDNPRHTLCRRCRSGGASVSPSPAPAQAAPAAAAGPRRRLPVAGLVAAFEGLFR